MAILELSCSTASGITSVSLHRRVIKKPSILTCISRHDFLGEKQRKGFKLRIKNAIHQHPGLVSYLPALLGSSSDTDQKLDIQISERKKIKIGLFFFSL